MSQAILPSPRKPGRPRNEKARKAILAIAHDMLVSDGLGRLTIEAVAARAGVGKPTIYRSWRNAHELAMAALLEEQKVTPAQAHSKNARKRLEAQMNRLVETFATARGKQIALAMAASDPDSEVAKAFRTQIILKSREEGRDILLQAKAQGEAKLPVDIDAILDAIYAPIFYRLLVGHKPLTAQFGRDTIALVFSGIGAPNHYSTSKPAQ